MTQGHTIIGVFFTADLHALLLVTLVTSLISVAIVAAISRHRRWPELVLWFILTQCAFLLFAHVIFTYWIESPFAKLEPIHMTAER